MKHLLLAAGVAVLALAPVGCNTSSSGGVAGTKDSFTLTGPTMTTTIKQGDRQTVEVTLDRKNDFKQDVKFEADAPKGLKVDFASKTVKASDPAKAAMTVEAEKDAPLGEHTITVKATPDHGNATTVPVKVKVEEKK